MNTLITQRLVLRRPKPSDADAFMAYTASDRFIRERGEQPESQRWGYFATLLGHWEIREFGRFLVSRRDTGTIIGHLGPLFPAGWPEREIAWHLWSDEAEGQGYAFEGAQAVLGHVFGTLGWTTAVSYIATTNARSQALARRLGAVLDPLAPRLPMDPTALVFRHRKPRGDA